MTSQLLNPEHYLLVQLKLSKDPAGASYHKILAAARRCLDDFAIELPETGFRLVKRGDVKELERCLHEHFAGYYNTFDDVLMLPAFPREEYSEWYYHAAEAELHTALAAELKTAAGKVAGKGRVTSLTYAKAIHRLNRAEHHIKTEELAAARKAIDLVWKADIRNRREKVSKFILSKVDMLEGYLNEED